MEALIYISFFILFGVCGYLMYQHVKLVRMLSEQDKNQKKALAEAGNAITDTLKVAFENIKRHGSEMNKLTSKYTETQSRIHRLEQTTQQIISRENKRTSTEQKEEIKNEKRNIKTG